MSDTCNCQNDQRHVHEFTGSTAVFLECDECHNHRFCTVSGEAMGEPARHVHEITFRTDFADGHYHEFYGKTTPPIMVGNGKHVHFIKEVTEPEDNHRHMFQGATLIDSPIDFDYHKQ